jgi:hypothetical protein
MDFSMMRRRASAEIEVPSAKLANYTACSQNMRKQGLSVVLYLDITNAFNTVNHRAVYHVLEANGFPAADITLFRRLYTGSSFFMSNQFGRSAACKLSRGMLQGAPPSPVVFSLVMDPIHSIVRKRLYVSGQYCPYWFQWLCRRLTPAH